MLEARTSTYANSILLLDLVILVFVVVPLTTTLIFAIHPTPFPLVFDSQLGCLVILDGLITD